MGGVCKGYVRLRLREVVVDLGFWQLPERISKITRFSETLGIGLQIEDLACQDQVLLSDFVKI